jgi:hypothetical protein
MDSIDIALRKLLADMAGPCDPDEWRPWRPARPDRRMPEGLTWVDRMRVRRAWMRVRAKIEIQYWCRLGIWRLRRWCR